MFRFTVIDSEILASLLYEIDIIRAQGKTAVLHPKCIVFLAHLSQSMIYCDNLTSIRPSVNIYLNNFSSETPGSNFFKRHMEPSVKEGLKICTNDLDPLIKMATMLMYGKNT